MFDTHVLSAFLGPWTSHAIRIEKFGACNLIFTTKTLSSGCCIGKIHGTQVNCLPGAAWRRRTKELLSFEIIQCYKSRVCSQRLEYIWVPSNKHWCGSEMKNIYGSIVEVWQNTNLRKWDSINMFSFDKHVEMTTPPKICPEYHDLTPSKKLSWSCNYKFILISDLNLRGVPSICQIGFCTTQRKRNFALNVSTSYIKQRFYILTS